MEPVTQRPMISDPRMPVVVGVLLAVVAVIEAGWRGAVVSVSAQQVTVYVLLALATTLPLATLRPTAAGVAASVAAALSLSLFNTLTVAGMCALLLTLYRMGRSLPLALALSAPYVVIALAGPYPVATEAAFLTVMLAGLAPAAALSGIAQRARSEALIHSAAREAVAGTLIEHTARGERARIARELHDVVAHHISMVAVQAETARLTTPGLPAAGAQRFAEIGDTARAGLTEMRRLLGVLREDAEDAGASVADRHPQPGLPQLAELIDAARDAAGTAARLIVSGPVAEFDPGVELAAYRIVQEALTNARRHAPGAAVDVELRYDDNALRLRIRDNGPGPERRPGPGGRALARPASGGHGLLGMRERALAVGGSLRTGSDAGGGFFVEAVLPAPQPLRAGLPAKPEVS
jgi:signal transduction histidine kinase